MAVVEEQVRSVLYVKPCVSQPRPGFVNKYRSSHRYRQCMNDMSNNNSVAAVEHVYAGVLLPLPTKFTRPSHQTCALAGSLCRPATPCRDGCVWSRELMPA